MRRMILAAMAVVGVQAGIGCNHVGGKCDCAPQPGEAITYAPSSNVLMTAPVSTGMPEGVANKAPKAMPNVYEGIGLPASLPKK